MSFFEAFHDIAQKIQHFLGEKEVAHDPAKFQTEHHEALNDAIDPEVIFKKIPYQYVDESHCYINKNSVGFGFLMEPSSGADESLMLTLANLIKNKIPPNVEVQCLLLAHPWVGKRIEEGVLGNQSDHPILRELAAQSKHYHQQAVLHGYENQRRIPAVLRDYQVFFWVSETKRKNVSTQLQELKTLRSELESEFQSAHLGFTTLTLSLFLTVVRRLITPNIHTVEWPPVVHDPELTLNHQVIEKGTSWSVEKEHMDITYSHMEKDVRSLKTTRVVNLGLNVLPKQFMLWMTPDNYCNLFEAQNGLTCPFIVNLIFKVKSRHQSQGKANTAFMVSEQTAGGSKDKFVTGAQETRHERKSMLDLLNDDKIRECELFYSLTLFSTPEKAKRDETNAIAAFRANGLELYLPQLLQMQHYLATLPFLSSEGLFYELNRFGLVRHKLKHFNVANLLPIVADFKGSRRGMLLPTFRHQLAFIDIFDDVRLPITSFNMTIAAQTGAGKSVFCQSLIEYLLGMKAQVFVIDTGDSYKHFCELVDGDYIDASTIQLNPFTLFDFDEHDDGDSSDEMIRDLLAVMAKSRQELLDVKMDWLLDAARFVRLQKGNKAQMDDVVDYLKSVSEENKVKGEYNQHLSDLILSLNKYTTGGTYGHIFNGTAPLLNKKPFVVLEMSKFRKKPKLARIIMHVMIVLINGQFYHSPRNQLKFCLIEEAWRHLVKKEQEDSDQEAAFLDEGFRTSRKYRGSFGVVVQDHGVLDGSPQGRAIQSCSDIKVIMRQGDDFDTYTEKYPDKFTTTEQVVIRKFGEAKNNGYSELMLKMGKVSSFHRLFLNPFAKTLFSSDGAEFEAVEQWKKKGLSLIEAVKKVSEERYGKVG